MTAKNRLAGETSPYLIQHADNPVDWYPWGAEALDKAGAEQKPILLSVGYSACHWCHVMAHESFEDPAIAALMNELFVNIKVDREERPDIDKLYQTAHQLIAQRAGGWPLTMFLTPDEQLPFFGGTYFPNEPRHGMPAFPELLQKVAAYYRENAARAREQGRALADVFSDLEPPPADSGTALNDAPLGAAREQLAAQYDRDNGGFGSQPKFPSTPSLERLLRHWRETAFAAEPDVDALFMVALALTRMSEGGLYDHVGGGFCRYTVDGAWQIPHFEKMLYDNGQLLALTSELWLAGGDPWLRQVAEGTARWITGEMQAPHGGFYSSLDADAGGEEGAYYVWTGAELKAALTQTQYEAVVQRFGVDRGPNFEGRHHLSVQRSLDDMAAQGAATRSQLESTLEEARKTLFSVRRKRTAPGCDEKILTSWNALAIRGLVIAGRAFGDAGLIDAARRSMDYLRACHWRDGRLLATSKDGSARLPAYLDDYAFTLDAALALLQVEFDRPLLEFAIALADSLLAHFEDSERGGFYFTADDHEALIHRARSFADDATPSGNGIAVRALTRLGFALGEDRYLGAAERALLAAWKAMEDYPHGHTTLLSALEEYLLGSEIVVLRGDADEIARWSQSAAALYAPRRLLLPIPADEDDLPGALALRRPVEDETVAYVCRGRSCSLPLTSWEALAEDLGEA
ncbi:MAG: thioredoxin domain-containing protein, partial [Pseudomonadota bacterium]